MYCVKTLPQCALNRRNGLISVLENVSMSPISILVAECGLILHACFHSQFIFAGLVPSMSFSFSRAFSSLIEVSSDRAFASSLDTVAFMDMLA